MRKTRRDMLKMAAMAAAGAAQGSVSRGAGAQPSVASRPSGHRPPNVVLIVADDLGYGDLGCYGNTLVRTPSIDAIAREGVRLTQHYSASPLCAPARAALLTGRYNHRTGAVDVPSNRGLDRIALSETTLADAFHAAGYVTGMIGKWHNGLHDMRYHPKARGFDHFWGFLNGGMDYYKWVLDWDGKETPADGRYLTDVFGEQARQFITRHKDRPFFLYLAYNAPHAPLQAPKDMVAHYRKAGGGKLTRDVATIYAMIERMDAGIGLLRKTLRTLGLTKNTLVLFTSDNGPWLGGASKRFNGPLRGQKGDALEGGIRVPAVLSWPGRLPPGTTVSRVVHFVDWLPTLLGRIGRRIHRAQKLDGRDVWAFLTGRPGRGNEPPQFWCWQRNRYEPVAHCNAAVREGRWKLYWRGVPEAMRKDPADNVPYRRGLTHAHKLMPIDTSLPPRELSAAAKPRLFDLEADPGETTDLAGKYPQRVARMRTLWDAWFAEVIRDYRRARAANIKAPPTTGKAR